MALLSLDSGTKKREIDYSLLFPGMKFERAFKTPEEEERFNEERYALAKPILDRLAEARRRSEELAMHHWVH